MSNLVFAKDTSKIMKKVIEMKSKLWTTCFRSASSIDQIPRAPYIPIGKIGSAPYIIKAGGASYLHEYSDKLHKKLGPIYVDHMGGAKMVFLADAEANIQAYRNEGQYPYHVVPAPWKKYLDVTKQKRGLFFMDGEDWLENRQIMNKILLKPSWTQNYIDQLAKSSKEFVEIWNKNPPGDELEFYLYCWTIECIGNVSFGTKMGFIDQLKHKRSNDGNTNSTSEEFINAIFNSFQESVNLSSMPWMNLAQKLNLPPWKRFSTAVSKTLEIAKEYVDKGIQESMASAPGQTIKSSLVYKLRKEENMDRDTIVKIIVDMILASGDTTAHCALFALYLLGRNPEQRELARKEVLEALKLEGGYINANYLSRLTYLKAVIKESLRLYPIATFLTRTVKKDTNLLGYIVPAETMIITSLYTMGRDKKYFSDPNSFQPERWLRTNSTNLIQVQKPKIITDHNNQAYIPWGLGARSCIGKRIAEMELLTLLSEALRNFDWTVEHDVSMIMRMVSVPSRSVVLNLKKLT